MNWQLPLFLNIGFGTIRAFLEKKLVAKVAPFMIFFYTVLWSGLVFILFYLTLYQSFPIIYPEMILLGILFTFSYGCYLQAMKINLSQTVIVASFYLIISLALAAFYLSEWRLFDPTTGVGQKTIIGMILTLLSIWMLVGADKKKEKINRKWLFFMVINVVLTGIGTFWSKTFIENHGSLETLISQSLGGLPVLFIINVINREKFKIGKASQVLAILDGLAIVGTTVFFFIALKNGPLAVILPVQTLIITVSIVLVGLIIFKEVQNMTKKKFAGMVLGIAGVILLMV